MQRQQEKQLPPRGANALFLHGSPLGSIQQALRALTLAACLLLQAHLGTQAQTLWCLPLGVGSVDIEFSICKMKGPRGRGGMCG